MHYIEADTSYIPEMARIRTEGGWEGGASQDRMTQYVEGRHHPQFALIPRVVYVALEGGAVVGYIAGHLTHRHECDGELQWIYVIPELRRSGIASELLRLLAAWFTSHNAPKICVDVDPGDRIARRFYIQHGAESLNKHWLVWNNINSVLSKR